MFNKKSFPKVLLMLAGLVFFSGNSVYLLENDRLSSQTLLDHEIYFNYESVLKGPYINAKAAFLINYDNGDVLYEKNSDAVRSIASISKLVMAMVVIDKELPLDTVLEISKEDAYRSSRSRLRRGYKLSAMDLMHAALLSSDNRAARCLARATSGSIEAFARDMNKKMEELGLEKSEFHEPTGLDKNNVSTAAEVAKILHYAYQYKLVKQITSKKRYYVKVVNKKNKKLDMVNTNLFIHSPYKVLTGKTGYIRAADYCLTTLLKNKKGERIGVVVLGVPGDKLRFREARKIVDFAYKNI